MDKLLSAVLDAHGGLENWSKVKKLTAQMSLGGPFWAARGWPDLYLNSSVTIDPHREYITFSPFAAPDRMSALKVNPERIAITTLDGGIIEERLNPRDSFPTPFGNDTRWDAIQVAYFTSAAVWNYLAAIRLYAARCRCPGNRSWTEGRQTWRRLAVTFPATIANHNSEQVFYYDDALMQRRMDYSPDVTGNPPVAHYSYDHRVFDGFVFPTRRLVHLRNADGIADQKFAAITIDRANRLAA